MRRLICTLAMMACAFLPATAGAATSVPCGANLNTYYAQAHGGDVLQLGACSYPATTIAYDSSKASASSRVVFQGQAGTTINDLNFRGAQHVEFRDVIVTNDVYATPQNNSQCGQDFTDAVFVNVQAGTFFLRSARDVTIRGGQAGPRHDGTASTVGPFNGCMLPANVTFDSVHFFNVDSDSCSGGVSTCHIECLFIQGVDGLVVKNSRFEQCAVFDVFESTIVGSATIRNVRLESNQFDAATDGGFYSIKNSGAWPFELVSNTFGQAVWFDAGSVITGCGNNAVVGMPSAQTQPCSSPPDTMPPDTTITAGPSDGTATDASFSFTATETGSTFECKLDAASFGACTSPKTYSGLAVSDHTFSVRATDQAGNTDQTPATRTWTVQAPPSSCDQACEDAYKAQIADLTAQLAAMTATAAARLDKLQRIRAILDE
jgi:hypothetical protein